MTGALGEEVLDSFSKIVRGEGHDLYPVSFGVCIDDHVLRRIIGLEVGMEGDFGVVQAGQELMGLEAGLS